MSCAGPPGQRHERTPFRPFERALRAGLAHHSAGFADLLQVGHDAGARCFAAVPGARAGCRGVGRRRQPLCRLRPGAAAGRAGLWRPRGRCGDPRAARARHQFQPGDRTGGRAGRTVVPVDPLRRDGALRQERLGCHFGGDPSGARGDRAGARGALWLSRLARLVYRQHGAPSGRAPGGLRTVGEFRLQRRRCVGRPARGQAPGVCRGDPGAGRQLRSQARLPGSGARPVRRAWRDPGVRRNRHRLPHPSRRRAGPLWRHPGPGLFRQGDGQRHADRRHRRSSAGDAGDGRDLLLRHVRRRSAVAGRQPGDRAQAGSAGRSGAHRRPGRAAGPGPSRRGGAGGLGHPLQGGRAGLAPGRQPAVGRAGRHHRHLAVPPRDGGRGSAAAGRGEPLPGAWRSRRAGRDIGGGAPRFRPDRRGLCQQRSRRLPARAAGTAGLSGAAAVTLADTAPVLVVAAHPDDEVLGCGGTVAGHAAAGRKVHVLILAEGATARDARRGAGRRQAELAAL
ncbi:MAG: hypothetical protein FJX68_15715, partial [Alphaproteobacteria bacterium]|nr:hypothetical protein [Alphaproteobacteria bacterium]